MFVAVMLLHIYCVMKCPQCIILRVEVVHSLNLNLESKWFEFIKDFKNRKLTLSGLKGKDLTRPS
jgi:hypothetical protein